MIDWASINRGQAPRQLTGSGAGDEPDLNKEVSPGIPKWFWDEYELNTLDGQEMFELSLEFVDSSFSLLTSHPGQPTTANFIFAINSSLRQLLRATGLLGLAMKDGFRPSTLDFSDWLARQMRILSHLPYEIDSVAAIAFGEGVRHVNALNRSKSVWFQALSKLGEAAQALVIYAREIVERVVKVVEEGATGIGVGIGAAAALVAAALLLK